MSELRKLAKVTFKKYRGSAVFKYRGSAVFSYLLHTTCILEKTGNTTHVVYVVVSFTFYLIKLL